MKESSMDTLVNYFNTISTWAALLIVINLIIVILVIVFFIRAWLVQTAVFKIQLDIEEIKNHISSRPNDTKKEN